MKLTSNTVSSPFVSGLAACLAGVTLLFGMGCAGLQLTTIKATQQRPSNVAIYFKVEDGAGQPLAGLTAEKFRIYEDDQLVSQYESKQTILNPEVAAVHYTLLLVDMSGSVSESGTGDAWKETAVTSKKAAFMARVLRVSMSQRVWVKR